MTTPFVGAHRREILARLIGDFDAVRSGAGPRLAFLEAPLGWGKTRIVHEFYAHLAAEQTEPYWPSSITGDVPADSGSDVSRLRKLLIPGAFGVPNRAMPDWLWLGVAADPSVLARPEQAYSVLAAQLEPHLSPVLRRQRLTAAAGRALLSALGTLLPIPPDFDSLLTVADGTREVFVEWWEGGEKTRTVGAGAADASAAFWKLLTSVWTPDGSGGPPIILVIEDAQFLTDPSVEMLGSLLASSLPLLVIATGWPLVDDDRYAPFRALVSSGSARVRVDGLESLQESDARELILQLHPGTDPELAEVLVAKFPENPYALQLFLWNHGAIPGTAFVYDVDLTWLANSSSTVESELKLQLAQAPRGAQLAVYIAGILGYRVPVATGDAAAAAHRSGPAIVDALRTDWMRRDRIDDQILAFVEPIRRRAATELATADIDPATRTRIIAAALEHLGSLLSDDSPDNDRALLETLYIELSQLSDERDENLLARSICGLLTHAWRQRMHKLGRLLLGYLDDGIHRERLDPEVAAEVAIEHSVRFRLFISAVNSRYRALTQSAVQAAEKVAAERPDLLVAALGEQSRTLLAKEIAKFDLDTAWELHRRSEQILATIENPPQSLIHTTRTREYALVAAGDDRPRAYALAVLEAERCAGVPELAGFSRNESLGMAVFYCARLDLRKSIPLSRDFIATLVHEYGTPTHPRVATAQKDLAVRMLRTYDDAHLPEAAALIERSLELLTLSTGRGSPTTTNTLAARSQLRRRLAKQAWERVDAGASSRWGVSALADAQELRVRRLTLQERTEPTISLRAHIALSEAWTGDESALERIRACVDERMTVREESRTHTELLWLVRDLRDAYVRFERKDDASALQDEFPAAFHDPYPA